MTFEMPPYSAISRVCRRSYKMPTIKKSAPVDAESSEIDPFPGSETQTCPPMDTIALGWSNPYGEPPRACCCEAGATRLGCARAPAAPPAEGIASVATTEHAANKHAAATTGTPLGATWRRRERPLTAA